jgi:hypothetical protein
MTVKELEATIKILQEHIQVQDKKLQVLEDIEAIKKLQKAYGCYVEHMMHDEIIDCFSDSPEVVLNWLEGQWIGKDGVRRYFNRPAGTAPDPMFLHQVMQLVGVIDVSPDGNRGWGRWYSFGGIFMPRDGKVQRSFVNGIYENEYIKENGIWKILKIKWMIPYSVRIDEGWNTAEGVTAPFYKGGATFGPKPDIPVDVTDLRYVSGYVFPFHYKHPVTGKGTSEGKLNSRLKPVKID